MDGTRKPAAPASTVDESQSADNVDIIFGDAQTYIVTTPWITAQVSRTITSTSDILSGDVGNLLLVNSSDGSCILGLNTGLGLTAGQRIDLVQMGVTQVQLSGTATLNPPSGRVKKLRAQYCAATILCTAVDTYVLIGDLASS